MNPPPSPPVQAEAAPGGTALTLVAGGATPARAEPDGVSLNPLGEWVIVAAWLLLAAVNLWTWRVLLKRRPAGSAR